MYYIHNSLLQGICCEKCAHYAVIYLVYIHGDDDFWCMFCFLFIAWVRTLPYLFQMVLRVAAMALLMCVVSPWLVLAVLLLIVAMATLLFFGSRTLQGVRSFRESGERQKDEDLCMSDYLGIDTGTCSQSVKVRLYHSLYQYVHVNCDAYFTR